MLLQSEIQIEAGVGRAFAFFERMHENYLLWHPDHLLFEWRTGQGLAAGVRFHFEERIGGKLLRKDVVFSEVVPDRLLRLVPTNPLMRLFLPSIGFEFLPTTGPGFRFRQTLPLRIGPIAAWLNRRDLAAVRQHMLEESENLKAILETGRPVHVRR